MSVTHFVLVVPYHDGRVPLPALVAALGFRASRQDSPKDSPKDSPSSTSDWTAVAHDGGAGGSERLERALRHVTAHARRCAEPQACETSCQTVVAYLGTTPQECELPLLRGLSDACVVRVFADCPPVLAESLRCLPRVRVHSDAPAAVAVWTARRRQPPASLRPAVAAARLAEGAGADACDDAQELLESAASRLPGVESDVVAGVLLDFLQATVPTLPSDFNAESLLAAAESVRAAAECPDGLSDHLPLLLQAKAELSTRLSACPRVSVRLSGPCAGRFRGLLLAEAPPQALGRATAPLLFGHLVRRQALFAALLGQPDAAGGRSLRCFRLDEADDSREVARALLRLGGADDGDADVTGGPAEAETRVTRQQEAAIRLRLRA